MRQDALDREVDAAVRKYVGNEAPGVALLLAKDGRVALKNGYGLADLKKRVPVTPGTRFLIASVSKAFTGAAVMLLRERGRLDYDDPVGRFYPDFPAWKDRVTVRHLLTHTGGVPEYLDDAFWQEPGSGKADQAAVLERIKTYEELDFPPGTHFRYSNSGYVMLGGIVERVSGQSFPRFLRRNVLGPLGMSRSLAGAGARRTAGQAVGYRPRGGSPGNATGFERAPYNRAVVGWADGNVVSTVEDLFLWDQALYTERLLPRAALTEAFTPVRPEDPSISRYGFGWFMSRLRGVAEVWHSGGTLGYSAHLARFPEQRASIILLSNLQGRDLAELAGALAGALLGESLTVPEPLSPDAVPAAWLVEKAGKYVDPLPRGRAKEPAAADEQPAGLVLEAQVPAGRLVVGERSHPLRPGAALLPLGRDRFRLETRGEVVVDFLREGVDGPPGTTAITGLRIDANGSVSNLVRRGRDGTAQDGQPGRTGGDG